MASLKFEKGKCHGATEAKAMMRHSDITPESREKASKGNPHIDVTKSHLNKSLLGLTYEEKCKRYDERIALLDATSNRNTRKDRVTLQMIEVAVPEDLPRRHYDKFFYNVAEIIADEVGMDNFISADIHYDEEHEYVDAETKELTMSRVHAHYGVIPEFNGQLSAQKLYSRSTMRRLNKKVEEMTQREFGCKFMTGTKKKSKETVDELKTKSEKLMAERENQQLQADNQRLRQENATLEMSLKQRSKKLDEDEEQLEADKAQFAAYRASESQKLMQTQQQAQDKLDKASQLYDKSRALHGKLMAMSDVFLDKYATDFGNELGSIKRGLDDGLSL